MTTFSWSKALLASVLVIYLAAMLMVTVLASHSRVDLGPVIRWGEQPELITEAPDFREITDIKTRKDAFFSFMQPLVERENAFYRQERDRLQVIVDKLAAGKTLGRSDYRKLAYWRSKLFIDESLTLEEQVDLLKLRLHVIPESMVLAQAATESAWGQSRFARQASNYFGQWCYTEGCGLVPKRRNSNAKHEVRHFDTALDAVQAYFLNINTHRAYRPLRDTRLALEESGEEITGYALVGELGKYSERGQDYIHELRMIIRGNELE